VAKVSAWLWLACCFVFVQVQAAPAQDSLRIASYNLRYANPGDGVNAWPHRKDAVNALIRFHGFDVFGTQEGLAQQIDDLARMDEYAHVGVGRDDGHSAGEHSSIFYRKARFTLLAHGDFWLSQTPDQPSKGWDAQCCNRIASWVKLRDLQSDKTFYVFSVHFDHQGLVARQESAKLLLRKIKDIAGDKPVVCVGDFNSTPDSAQMATMRSALRDAREHSATPPYGPHASFNGFQWSITPKERIDYIFVNDAVRVLTYGTLTDSQDQRYPSDHFPVLTDLVLAR
jgi:endonuclease/exonuclease/phosphatase family metal-dependent hydrolase